MTCRDLIEFLSDYQEGDLTEEQLAVFEAHLRACPECRRYVDQFKKTVEMTKRLGADQPTCDLPEELVRAIAAAAQQKI